MNINNIEDVVNKINESNEIKALEEIYHKLFSKTGVFSVAMKEISSLGLEEKKEKGKYLNEKKGFLKNLIIGKQEKLRIEELTARIEGERIDLTLPFVENRKGGVHPISFVVEQIIAIFGDLGFKVASGEEIVDDWYNFSALNIPLHHPSRQDHDTFYVNMLDEYQQRKVLRTHTSSVQIKAMFNNKEMPLKIIAPGRTYRSDSDSTHSPMFHQVEGLYVDKKENISVPLLRAVLLNFCSKFFGINDLPIRLRPSYFPFTSPSYEVDILCDRTKDQLIIGQGSDWLEILGSGIVDDKVLANCGIDSNLYAGFAFGMGIERIAMLKYGIKDLRTFFESDVRWLDHNNFSAIKTPTLFGGLN